MIMKKKLWILAAIITVVLLGVFVFSNKDDSDTIKIGALLSLTGDNAQQGNLAKNGILIAVEKANNDGGINGKKIELVIEDTHTDANGTITAMKKLATLDKVKGIVVTGDIELPVVNQIADHYNILIMATICTGMIDNNRSEWVYRYCYNEEQEDDFLMKYVAQDLGIKKMALLYPNSTAGQAFYKYSKQYIDANGIQVVADIAYDVQSTSVQRENAVKVMNSNPEIICARGFGPSLDALLRHIKELSYKGRVVGDLSLSVPSAIKNTNGILNGAYIVASDLDMKSGNAVVASYAEKYTSKFNIAPCFWDAIAYDSFMYLYYGMKESEEKSTTFKDAIFSIKPQDLLLGENWFEKENDVVFKMHIFEMNNGNMTLVK